MTKHWEVRMMKISPLLSYLVAVILLGLINACSSSVPTSSVSLDQPYDFESDRLHPAYKLFHQTADTSVLYVRVHSSELLYARRNADEAFRCEMRVSARAYYGNTLIDSTSATIRDEALDNRGKAIDLSLKLALADTSFGELIFTVYDRLRDEAVSFRQSFDKRNSLNEHNFLLVDRKNSRPVLGNSLLAGQLLDVYARNGLKGKYVLHQFTAQRSLPPPPFSYHNPEALSQMQASKTRTLEAENGRLSFLAESGLYLLTAEGAGQGISAEVRAEGFPRIGKLEDLVKTLRYITSRNEYEDMATSAEMKLKLDEFWLDCGGQADKARDLIRIFYSRVEEANRNFSCHEEGWRTDRGLVHLVYGNPTKVNRKPGYEVWIYGEENNINALNFTFQQVDNPFTTNYYVLLRDPVYKTSWSRAVDSWRNGRIYNQ